MKKIALIAASLVGLSGCVAPVGQSSSSFLNKAQAPQYVLSGSGQPVSTKCKAARTGGFGTRPPGCTVDSIFADQVAYPHDLTSPHRPGSTTPHTTVQGASDYLFGDEAASAN